MILRKYSGGYHAKTFSHCAIGSILLLFLCIKFSMQIKCDWKLLFVTVIASVSLIKFSPMDHESRRLDEAEKYRYKKIVIGLVCTLDMLCIILFIQGYHNLIISMCVGIQMTAGVQPVSYTHLDVYKRQDTSSAGDYRDYGTEYFGWDNVAAGNPQKRRGCI